MKTKTIYICDHCERRFDEPCELHEIECLAEKERAAQIEKAKDRAELMCNILLGQKTDGPVGAIINGTVFLVSTPFSWKTIKSIAAATQLISASAIPTKRDVEMLKKANELLAD